MFTVIKAIMRKAGHLLPGVILDVYSIKDHVMPDIDNKPNYIDNYTIRVDSDSDPWTFQAAYDMVLKQTHYKNDELYIDDEFNLTKGHVADFNQNFIDSLRAENVSIILKQLSPYLFIGDREVM